ncbi:hypothetical protein [Streptomyces sp. NPDC002769]|uniref:hypothetical protein n=1 Tax=Streptomyces sp. NPDC002769 TaxID=3154542 RepID=UPI00331EB538
MRDVYVVDAVRAPFGRDDGSPPTGLPGDPAAHTVRELLAPVPALCIGDGQGPALALSASPSLER